MSSASRETTLIPASLKQKPQNDTPNTKCVGCVAITQLDDPRSPLTIVEATHGTDDFLMHAVVHNVGKSKVQSFRIGWMVIYRDNKTTSQGIGAPITPSKGIAPGMFDGVPSQGFTTPIDKGDVARVVFYVASAQTEDGKVFTANVGEIESASRKRQADAEPYLAGKVIPH